MKKTLLTLGTITAVAIPVALVVSCGQGIDQDIARINSIQKNDTPNT